MGLLSRCMQAILRVRESDTVPWASDKVGLVKRMNKGMKSGMKKTKKTKKTGALITAAGMSSRMGDFKPLMNIGSISVVKRLIFTLQAAECSPIVLITGHRSEDLKKHVEGMDVICLKNENYETNQMFDSVKIGLAYLADKCEQLIFTPVDVPLFKAHTVSILIASDAKLAVPVCEGKEGHPLLIGQDILESLLLFQGDHGLAGAIAECSVEKRLIEVEDEGILYDADTKEDFNELQKRYEKQKSFPPYGRINLLNAKGQSLFVKSTECKCKTAPTREMCIEILRNQHLPEKVTSHCLAVMEKAVNLAEDLISHNPSIKLDMDVVTAAALLHDMARTGSHHAKEGARRLEEEGYPLVADIIARHHDLETESYTSLDEALIVYLADKYIDGLSEVSLVQRFEKSYHRCITKEAKEIHRKRYKQAIQAEEILIRAMM